MDDDFDMQPVSSSNLAAVGFNAETGTGRVEFTSGAIYDYEGCTQEEADQIIHAPSAGSMFNALWRGKSYQRVG